jgi:hypothetical protein
MVDGSSVVKKYVSWIPSAITSWTRLVADALPCVEEVMRRVRPSSVVPIGAL